MKKKYVYFIIIFIFFIMFVDKINASALVNVLDVKFCQREEITRVLHLIALLINIVRVAVPIILIISAMIKLTSAITKNDGLDKVKGVLITNIVAAILIFLVPTFVSIIAKLTGSYELLQACFKLSESPTSTPGSSGGNNSGSSKSNLPSITSITHKGAYVIVNAKSGKTGDIVGYYFSGVNKEPSLNDDKWILKSTNKLEIVKLPGTYYVYVKDKSNFISKPANLKITFEELYKDGPRSRDDKIPAINGEIDGVLKSKGDSKANLDDMMAWSVKSAGLFTKEGVATAGIAAASYLHGKHNLHISYVCNIYCFGQRYNVHFGSNPSWGHVIQLKEISQKTTNYKTGETIYPRQEAQSMGIKNYCKGLYGGLDCQSFFGWAVHNGGFKAENTHGSYIGKNKAKEVSCGKSCSKAQVQDLLLQLVIGDELFNDAHVMMFLGFYDDNNDKKKDGIYVFESATRVGMYKWSWDMLYRSKYFGINKMEGYYSNKNNYACLQDYKGNLVNIPNAWKDKTSLFRKDCKA